MNSCHHPVSCRSDTMQCNKATAFRNDMNASTFEVENKCSPMVSKDLCKVQMFIKISLGALLKLLLNALLLIVMTFNQRC